MSKKGNQAVVKAEDETTQQPNTVVPKQKRVIKPMTEVNIKVEMAKPTHQPYMTYTMNGQQYIGKEDGTLLLKPRVFQTKQSHGVLSVISEIVMEAHTNLKLCKEANSDKVYLQLWKTKADGTPLLVSAKSKNPRPQYSLPLSVEVAKELGESLSQL